jgi:hypothetical protein
MRLVMPTALFLLTSVLLLLSAFAETQPKKPAFDDFYLSALNGDVMTALEIVDSYADDDLSPDQLKEKNRFIRRFRSSDDIAFTGESKLVNDIMTMFHTYWDKMLLKKVPGDQALNELLMPAVAYLHENYLKETGISIEDVQNNAPAYLSDLLLKEGYHVQIGQTGHIMDIPLEAGGSAEIQR